MGTGRVLGRHGVPLPKGTTAKQETLLQFPVRSTSVSLPTSQKRKSDGPSYSHGRMSASRRRK
jgi:hypothetical protein